MAGDVYKRQGHGSGEETVADIPGHHRRRTLDALTEPGRPPPPVARRAHRHGESQVDRHAGDVAADVVDVLPDQGHPAGGGGGGGDGSRPERLIQSPGGGVARAAGPGHVVGARPEWPVAGSPRAPSSRCRARSMLTAAPMRARWVKACG